jgi:hypothetical protein
VVPDTPARSLTDELKKQSFEEEVRCIISLFGSSFED